MEIFMEKVKWTIFIYELRLDHIYFFVLRKKRSFKKHLFKKYNFTWYKICYFSNYRIVDYGIKTFRSF